MDALKPNPMTTVRFRDPPLVRYLFADTRSAWIWLIPRAYVAYIWLGAFWSKINNPEWTQSGEALHGFWLKALAQPETVVSFDWYRGFLQYMVDTQAWTWFSKLVIAGELLVGLSILFGAFVGIGAFAGAFMNWNYLLAGSVSTNPVLLVLEVVLILAWKVAGWIGLDRYLFPLLGTPWAPAREIQAEMPLSEQPLNPLPVRVTQK